MGRETSAFYRNKLTPVELARLDAYCFRIRTTRYSLLRTLVLEELAAYERENRVT